MDSWLWDPPIYEEEDYSLRANWQPDIEYWRKPDPLENDAANEQACIQVLKILIAKENSDITQLKEEIILLQSQPAWTEEAWSEMCFIDFREKIKSLEISTNENQQDQQEGELHGEPVAKIHEILKPLLEKYFLQKDDQNSSSNVDNPVFSQSKDETRVINIVAEVCDAKKSGQTPMSSCSEAQKEDDKINKDQDGDAVIMDQLIDVSSNAFEEYNQTNLDRITSNREHVTGYHAFTKVGKRIYRPENDKVYVKHANIGLRNASGITSTCEAGSNSRKLGSNHDSGEIIMGTQMLSFTNKSTILNPLPKSEELILEEPAKLADMKPDSMSNTVEKVTKKSIKKQPMEMEVEDGNQANKVDPKSQLMTMGWMGTRNPLEVGNNDKLLNDRECTIAGSPRELLYPEIKMIPDGVGAQVQNLSIPIPQKLEQMHNIEVTGSQLEPQPAQEPCLSKPSSMENLQNCRSMNTKKYAGSSSANRRRTTLDFKRKRSPNATPDASEVGNIQTTAKRQKDMAHGMIQKDHLMGNCQTAEARVEKPLNPLSSSSSTEREPARALECFTLDKLKKLAKVNGLKGLSKFRKEELVKILKAKSRDGDLQEL